MQGLSGLHQLLLRERVSVCFEVQVCNFTGVCTFGCVCRFVCLILFFLASQAAPFFLGSPPCVTWSSPEAPSTPLIRPDPFRLPGACVCVFAQMRVYVFSGQLTGLWLSLLLVTNWNVRVLFVVNYSMKKFFIGNVFISDHIKTYTHTYFILIKVMRLNIWLIDWIMSVQDSGNVILWSILQPY